MNGAALHAFAAKARGEAVPNLLEMVEVGCLVYEHMDPDAFGFEPRGGLVWSIDHAADSETGEVERLFHVVSVRKGRIHWQNLRAHQISEDSLAPPSGSETWKVIRFLCQDICRKSSADSQAMKAFDVAFALLRPTR